jgi:hypothetical protein
MSRVRNAVAGAVLVALLSLPVRAALGQDQPAPAAESDAEHEAKRSAPVLCVWQLLLATQLVGQRCHGGEDPALQAELDASIKRVDAFISANDVSATADKVEAFKQQFREQSAGGDICKNPDAVAVYDDAKRAGADRIRSDTDDLVAVPRFPTKDGC